jgi:hypothetical protein
MTRSLLLTIALALSCLGGATAAYMAGRASAPDLNIVARAGTSAGVASGSRAGSSTGKSAGFRAGYRAGYAHSYQDAYRTAYLRALGH